MYEVLTHYMPKIKKSKILNKLNLRKHKYFVVSAHREENVDDFDKLSVFISALNQIVDKYNFEVIFSVHPRTRVSIDKCKTKINKRIKLLKPLCFTDYVHLQMNSLVTLSDSGTISEESSILNFNALNIREAHERPEAMEEASVPLVGFSAERIIQGIEHIISTEPNLKIVNDYSMHNVSEKVVRIILSYTDYVNRVVWQKK